MSGLTISASAKGAAIALLSMMVAACQPGPAPRVTASASPSPKASAIAACPAATASPGQQVLLQNQPAPDDLAFDNAGRLLFSDIKTRSEERRVGKACTTRWE